MIGSASGATDSLTASSINASPDIDCTGPIVEEEREAAPLLLLGGDDLLGEPCALGFADLRVLQQPRVLALARCEVGEHRRACDVGASERPGAHEMERPDVLLSHAEWHEDPLSPVRRCGRLLVGTEELRARVEEPLRLDARVLEHRLRPAARGDLVHRLDQRLEERRLSRELLLDAAMTVSLDEEQVDRDEAGRGERSQQHQPPERGGIAARVEDRRNGREHGRADEDGGPSR